MQNDKVFEFLKAICNNRVIVDEYQNLFLKTIEHFTTGKNIKLDFLIIFTISIFDQAGTYMFLLNTRIRNQWLMERLNEGDGEFGINHKANKDKLSGLIPQWIKDPNELKRSDNFLYKVEQWLNAFQKNPNKNYNKHNKCFSGVKKFKKFLDRINKKQLYSYIEFKKALINERIITENNSEIKCEIKYMGEKTFSLFIEQPGFYAKGKQKLKKWIEQSEYFPVYGFNETYIRYFLKEIYKYYGNTLHHSGLFKNFHLNSPVSIDVLWNAYRRKETLLKFLKGETSWMETKKV